MNQVLSLAVSKIERENAQLKRDKALLQEHVDYLEATLRDVGAAQKSDTPLVPACLRLPPQEARALNAILKLELASHEMLILSTQEPRGAPMVESTVKVLISRLRARLKKYGIEVTIHNEPCIGYRMSPNDKAVIARLRDKPIDYFQKQSVA